jgi:hypothetical protein
VRNGQRWHVTRINPDNNRLIARRLDDQTLGAFTGDYVRRHITHGYALTVHSAQGATADTTHAVLGENATRALAYVAMTRGRDTNTAHLYQQFGGRPNTADSIHPTGRTRYSAAPATTPYSSPEPFCLTIDRRSPRMTLRPALRWIIANRGRPHSSHAAQRR